MPWLIPFIICSAHHASMLHAITSKIGNDDICCARSHTHTNTDTNSNSHTADPHTAIPPAPPKPSRSALHDWAHQAHFLHMPHKTRGVGPARPGRCKPPRRRGREAQSRQSGDDLHEKLGEGQDRIGELHEIVAMVRGRISADALSGEVGGGSSDVGVTLGYHVQGKEWWWSGKNR